MLRAVTLLLVLDACTGYNFRVCGNYCGPGWCNAKWEKEANCNDSVSACLPSFFSTQCHFTLGWCTTLPLRVDSLLYFDSLTTLDSTPRSPLQADTDGSCEDACCKLHDTCCGHKTPSTGKADCNRHIVKCLDACSSAKPWCRDGLDIPIPNKVIADAMDLVEDWCCGGPCPKQDGAALRVALGSNRSSGTLVEEEELAQPAAGDLAAAGAEGGPILY